MELKIKTHIETYLKLEANLQNSRGKFSIFLVLLIGSFLLLPLWILAIGKTVIIVGLSINTAVVLCFLLLTIRFIKIYKFNKKKFREHKLVFNFEHSDTWKTFTSGNNFYNKVTNIFNIYSNSNILVDEDGLVSFFQNFIVFVIDDKVNVFFGKAILGPARLTEDIIDERYADEFIFKTFDSERWLHPRKNGERDRRYSYNPLLKHYKILLLDILGAKFEIPSLAFYSLMIQMFSNPVVPINKIDLLDTSLTIEKTGECDSNIKPNDAIKLSIDIEAQALEAKNFKILDKQPYNELYLPVNEDQNDLIDINPFNRGQKESRLDACITYISDLHLDYKITEHFKDTPSKLEIRIYIRKVAEEIFNNYRNAKGNLLLIIGDVSNNFEIVKMFLEELGSVFFRKVIIYIPGNHELWIDRPTSDEVEKDIENIFNEYKEIAKANGIIFLHNKLLLSKYSYADGDLTSNLKVLTKDDILCLDNETLARELDQYNFCLFAGLGFSGRNKSWNASHGLYNKTLTTIEDDLKLSNITNEIHRKLVNAVGNKKILFVTHTPLSDWSPDKYNEHWIYMNGHTHQNFYEINNNINVYADNQIGYKKDAYPLKYIYLDGKYDTLAKLIDGIHIITADEYKDFYDGKGKRIQFNHKNGKIIMIKNSGIYMFFYEKENRKRFILKGGQLINLKNSKPYKYYYDNIIKMAQAFKEGFKDYDLMQREISNYIKMIGGSGTIHGSIVDIDFFNHILLNPFDLSITPYFATSVTDKYVFKNLESLLLVKAPELHPNYVKLIKNNTEQKHALIIFKDGENLNINAKHSKETDIYSFSNKINILQRLNNLSILTFWDDSALEKQADLTKLLH